MIPVKTLIHHPTTDSEILDLIIQAKITPLEAFALFQELDQGRYSPRIGGHKPKEGLSNQEQLAAAMEELDQLIGLDNVKAAIKEIQAFVQIQQLRREMGLAAAVVLHAVFSGNPGTGKTTVARILGRIIAMGILPQGHLVEVERADLVGEYIGHTATKTKEQIKKAMGGVLFVDEAYSLARGGAKDFGKEAIDTLVKAMEDYKNEFILILAGYRDEMETFLQVNPGLKSRFPLHLKFRDYSERELISIAEQMFSQRQYHLTPRAKIKLIYLIEEAKRNSQGNFGNARTVRNLVEKAIRRQAVRLVAQQRPGKEELMSIETVDITRG